MCPGVDIKAADIGRLNNFHAGRFYPCRQMIFNVAAIDLVSGDSKSLACAQLILMREICRRRTKKHADAEFLQMGFLQMIRKPQVLGQIMRTNFHRGFTHFGNGFGAREGVFFQHHNVQFGRSGFCLQREAQACQSATGNNQVAMPGHWRCSTVRLMARAGPMPSEVRAAWLDGGWPSRLSRPRIPAAGFVAASLAKSGSANSTAAACCSSVSVSTTGLSSPA